MSATPIGELEFLRKLQRLLAEGDFVATYKFALLNALADLSLEREPAADGSLRMPVSAIAPAHLERWQESHLERATELAQRFDSLALPHDDARSRAIAWWAYEQGEAAGAHAWIDADRFARLGSSWRDVLGPRPGDLRRVAEPPPPEYRPE